MTLEVLKIIYKNPCLRPKKIHSKRTLKLYRTIYSILMHMRFGGLVEKQKDGSYIITDPGKREWRRLTSSVKEVK